MLQVDATIQPFEFPSYHTHRNVRTPVTSETPSCMTPTGRKIPKSLPMRHPPQPRSRKHQSPHAPPADLRRGSDLSSFPDCPALRTIVANCVNRGRRPAVPSLRCGIPCMYTHACVRSHPRSHWAFRHVHRAPAAAVEVEWTPSCIAVAIHRPSVRACLTVGPMVASPACERQARCVPEGSREAIDGGGQG